MVCCLISCARKQQEGGKRQVVSSLAYSSVLKMEDDMKIILSQNYKALYTKRQKSS
jgi:hypothetical protein